jgi:A49-like RNA polymerase I associated factor
MCFSNSQITQYLQTTFAQEQEGGAYKPTAQLKDKLLSYILVLKMHLNSFSIDPQEIAGDFNMSITKMCLIAKELGARIDTKKAEGQTKKKIFLALPLVFPTRTRQ